MTKKEVEMGATCLNYPGLVANWWRTAAGTDPRCRRKPQVTIFEAAAMDEHVYCPAVSVTIYGPEALLALRSVIDEALRNEPDEDKK